MNVNVYDCSKRVELCKSKYFTDVCILRMKNCQFFLKSVHSSDFHHCRRRCHYRECRNCVASSEPCLMCITARYTRHEIQMNVAILYIYAYLCKNGYVFSFEFKTFICMYNIVYRYTYM